jgi:succinate dehydrogenase / fumarate reductase cytochrome b subunit
MAQTLSPKPGPSGGDRSARGTVGEGSGRGPVTGTALMSSTGKRRAPFPIELYRSALGKKYVMAVTGIIWMGFVLAHMVGNLKSFLGPAEFNHYAEFLRELLVPILPRTVVLWLLRLTLIAAIALHIHAATTLTIMNRKARPVRYQSSRDYVAATFASRTMRYTGVLVLLFLFVHLGDLTWGWFNPGFTRGDAYRNLDASLSRWWMNLFYIVCNLALFLHLWHGGWSLFQSLGWNNPRFNLTRRWFALGFAGIVVAGNVAICIGVLSGVIGL